MLAQISMLPASLAWFLAVWMFTLGACIGSFMNVVIYRLPEGLALAKPNSRCPKCLHAIRWFDNIPMLSWLFLLRARCRDCRAVIPARYPFVELLVAAIFFVFGTLEGLDSASNLPLRLPLSTDIASSWIVMGFHLLLICTLVCAAFMIYDGKRPPLRLFAPAFLAGIIGPLIWQNLRPVGVVTAGWSDTEASLLEMAGGAFIGAWMGWLSSRLLRGGDQQDIRTYCLIGALTGVMLGWQAVALLAAVTASCWLIRSFLVDTSLAGVPFAGWYTAAVVVLLLNWRWLDQSLPFLTRDMDLMFLAIASLLVVAVRALAPWRRVPTRVASESI